jgi:RNA polymerase sigma factor (TIGR02999 family)
MSLTEEQNALAEQLIAAVRSGDEEARKELVAIMFPDFRRHARKLLNDAPPGLTEDSVGIASALWIKMISYDNLEKVRDTRHLLHLGKGMMKQVFLDYLKARLRQKRPQWKDRLPEQALLTVPFISSDIEEFELEDALRSYAKVDPLAAEAIECILFMGLTGKETAAVLDVSWTSLQRRLDAARPFFARYLGRGDDDARASQ